MDEKTLQQTGLTNSEIKTYTTLLKTGSIKVGDLTKHLTLHRSRIYEALTRLSQKGLVSHITKNNTKYFQATNPDNILSYLQEQKEKLKQKEKSIKKILPQLKTQIPKALPTAQAQILIGKEGFKTMRKDVLKQKQTLYLIGAVGKEDEYLEYFFPNFNKLRIKNKINWKILYDQNVKGKSITKLKFIQTKYLPKEYSSPTVINIYADRVVNVIWKDKTPLCIMMISKEIAESYKKWFDFLWKKVKN
jgi:sugar-specific transcriptional regulator TrmB